MQRVAVVGTAWQVVVEGLAQRVGEGLHRIVVRVVVVNVFVMLFLLVVAGVVLAPCRGTNGWVVAVASLRLVVVAADCFQRGSSEFFSSSLTIFALGLAAPPMSQNLHRLQEA